MKYFKWVYIALGCTLFTLAVQSCSDSSSNTGPTYPLTLTLLYHSKNPVYDTLLFQVTKNGKGVAGAKLTSLSEPYYYSNADLGIRSDTAGKFTALNITNDDSAAEIAYQAVLDSLTSNYTYWSWTN